MIRRHTQWEKVTKNKNTKKYRISFLSFPTADDDYRNYSVSGWLEFLPAWNFLLFSHNRLSSSSVLHYLLSSIALNLTVHP